MTFIRKKKNFKKKILIAHLYIQCTLKNTILSLTRSNGELYKQWSSKSLKKTSLKKNTPYNIQLITNRCTKYLFKKKIKILKIFLQGNGRGRYHVIKNIDKRKFHILNIFDTTYLPFNGCRQKKQKRR